VKDIPTTKKIFFDSSQYKKARSAVDHVIDETNSSSTINKALNHLSGEQKRVVQFGKDTGLIKQGNLAKEGLSKEIMSREMGKAITYGSGLGAAYLGADTAGRAFTNAKGQKDVPLLPFI
jgi:hypothetical protein